MARRSHVSQPQVAKSESLLERVDALECIEERVVLAAAGHGSILTIQGRPGEGKSALLLAACELAASRGLRVCRARGSELEREFALGGARQLLEPAVNSLLEPDRARLMGGAAGLAASVLDIDMPASPASSFAAMHGLYWLLAGLAARQPMLLAIDDGHWLDLVTLQWLVYLRQRIQDVGVLVVVACRPVEMNHVAGPLLELTGDPELRHLLVGPLSLEALRTLIERTWTPLPRISSPRRFTGSAAAIRSRRASCSATGPSAS